MLVRQILCEAEYVFVCMIVCECFIHLKSRGISVFQVSVCLFVWVSLTVCVCGRVGVCLSLSLCG